MKNAKTKLQKRKIVVLSLNRNLCLLASSEKFPIFHKAYNKAPIKNPNSIVNRYYIFKASQKLEKIKHFITLSKTKNSCGNLASILRVCEKASVIYNTGGIK